MKKLESTFLNMIISLTLVTLIAGVSLAYMNELTKGPIAEARKQKQIKAIRNVLPETTNNPFAEKKSIAVEGGKDSIFIFPGLKGDELSGMAVSTFSTKGYNGLIRLMVGFSDKGEIYNIVVLEQKETPGLGTKMTSNSFLEQFKGRSSGNFDFRVKKDGGDIDAITGATISSRAFGDAVKTAYDIFLIEKKKIEIKK